jgi:hypothetical protein
MSHILFSEHKVALLKSDHYDFQVVYDEMGPRYWRVDTEAWQT